MKRSRFFAFAATFFLVLLFFVLVSETQCRSARHQSSRLFSVPFTHVSQNEPLSTVLYEFARVQGYTAVVSPALTASVTGNFEAVNPYQFLSSMAAAYRVGWFYQSGTVTFYDQAEVEHAFLTPTVIKAVELMRLFRDAGILSPQLAVRLVADRNVIYVRGPRFYVNQLTQAMRSMEGARVSHVVMRVFPLKHAWAEDKTVDVGYDSTLTIPGVASILQSVVGGEKTGGSYVRRNSPVQQGLLGHGLSQYRQGGAGTPEGTGSSPLPIVQQPSEDRQTQQNGAGPAITADPRMNAVVVTDSEYRMDYYAKVIAELDKPVRLVEIHAAIVDIDSNFKRELGINFQGQADLGNGWRIGGTGGGTAATGALPAVGEASDGGLSFSTLYTKGTDFFLTRVRALEEDGVARMLGRPSVLTTDNVQATLQNTNTYYIPVSGYQATDLFKVETGTVLSVTPHIIPGRTLPGGRWLPEAIKLIVTVQDNRNDNNSTFVVSGTSPTPLKQTKINTQAIVGHGQSLLVAGYYFETQSDDDTGVAGLKNIPLLGRLFNTAKKGHSRRERLILITPRIIDIDSPPALPKRLDDPRFSRSPTEPSYAERVPSKPPVGGCTRRRLDYASTPDYAPKNGPVHPVPMGEPAEPLVKKP